MGSYVQRVAGLGRRFLNEFETAVSKIQEAPESWQRVKDDLRRYVMPRFPFGIYYRIEGEELRILVIKHHSRHPGYWNYRVQE